MQSLGNLWIFHMVCCAVLCCAVLCCAVLCCAVLCGGVVPVCTTVLRMVFWHAELQHCASGDSHKQETSTTCLDNILLHALCHAHTQNVVGELLVCGWNAVSVRTQQLLVSIIITVITPHTVTFYPLTVTPT